MEPHELDAALMPGPPSRGVLELHTKKRDDAKMDPTGRYLLERDDGGMYTWVGVFNFLCPLVMIVILGASLIALVMFTLSGIGYGTGVGIRSLNQAIGAQSVGDSDYFVSAPPTP